MTVVPTVCPHCMNHVSGDHLWGDSCSEEPNVRYYALRCPNSACHRFFLYRHAPSEGDSFVPAPRLSLHLDVELPTAVDRDFAEAAASLYSGAPNGSVLMCRRAIQSTAVHFGASVWQDEDKQRPVSVYRHIEYLRDQGFLTPKMAEAAHEVRALAGEQAGHPSEDPLQRVDRSTAQQCLDLTRLLLRMVFMTPPDFRSSPESASAQ